MKRSIERIPAPLWIIAGAILFWLAFSHAYLNYDTFYAMLWGQDILHGRLPDYEFAIAPTPHPLVTLISMAAVPFGSAADDILLGISFLAFAALVWCVFRLGSLAFGWPVGLLAAVIVATRQPLDSYAIRAYIDIPFAALVLYAALLEARLPKRGVPVLVLLAVAGLLRPEAWLFAGVYFLYIAWDAGWTRRIWLAALALSAPLLWALTDLLITGDPLHSLHGTSALDDELQRRRTLLDVPIAVPESLGYVLRIPVLIGAVVGAAFAWFYAKRKAAVLAVLILLNGVTFVALAVAGLPLLARYLLIAATVTAIFGSAGALGWLQLSKGKDRRAWAIAGFVVIALLVAFIPAQYSRLSRLHDTTVSRGEMQEDIRGLTEQADAKRYLDACQPIYTPNHRAVPMLRYWLEAPTNAVISAQTLDGPPRKGVMLAANTPQVRRVFVLDPRDRENLNAPVPKDFRKVAKNRSWALYASPSCLRSLQG